MEAQAPYSKERFICDVPVNLIHRNQPPVHISEAVLPGKYIYDKL